MGDVVADLLDQGLDRAEGAAADRLAGDDAEPGLDLVEPLESTAAVAAALAALYAHGYGVDPEKVQLAAAERAAAVRISDRWVRDGRDPASPSLGEERAALVRSYAALLAAVHS